MRRPSVIRNARRPVPHPADRRARQGAGTSGQNCANARTDATKCNAGPAVEPLEILRDNKIHSPFPPEQPQRQGEWIEVLLTVSSHYCTVTATALDGIPFVTTTSALAPVSVPADTVKCVDTGRVPVATAMVLGLNVRA